MQGMPLHTLQSPQEKSPESEQPARNPKSEVDEDPEEKQEVLEDTPQERAHESFSANGHIAWQPPQALPEPHRCSFVCDTLGRDAVHVCVCVCVEQLACGCAL